MTRDTGQSNAAVALAPVTLAAIPSPSTSVWFLGPVPLRAYALCIVAGIVAACWITEVRLRRRGAPPYTVLDIAVWAVPFGIVGARIYHVITSPDQYFGPGGDPMGALRIWEGGLGVWGAIAFGALGAWFACRRRGIPLSMVADAAAVGIPVAQALGRMGNWFNNELYGGRTTLPWGLEVHEMDQATGKALTDTDGKAVTLDGLYHPTFAYELLWNLGTAGFVWLLDRRFKFGRGRAFALYVMAYVVGRFWIEGMRIDPAHSFAGLRLNQWVSIGVFVAALAYFLLMRGPRQRLVVGEDGEVVGVVVDTGQAPVVASYGSQAVERSDVAAVSSADDDDTDDHYTDDDDDTGPDGGDAVEDSDDEPPRDRSRDEPQPTGEPGSADEAQPSAGR